jgi:D-alanyl-lipoteichoic acid acyltransferase DltB (MBOAT superfamily)
MLFTSLDFFLFLAIALAVFALLPQRARTGWLLLASCIFYGWNRPSQLLWLGAVTLVVLLCGAALARTRSDDNRRVWLVAGLVAVIGSLAATKFHDFGVAAPAGFSFYAFSAASFLIDSFRRKLPADASVGETALYLAWFPKILAGPIERATSFVPNLRDRIPPTPHEIVMAAQMIGWGLVKKVVIADNLAPIVDRTFGIVAFASPVDLMIAIYFFAFQIYCDFSGYTDIALGVSLLFGLPLAENFKRPYLSHSAAEFWSERWHISLGRWFRDYLFIPLGGSRVGAMRRYMNVMLVFLASGLWHAGLGYGAVGWTFVVWCALNGAYVWAGVASAPFWRWAAERLPRVASSRIWGALRIVLTFHLVTIAWVFFRAKSLHDASLIFTKLGKQAAQIPELIAHYPYSPDHLLGFALIAVLLVVELIDERKSIYRRLASWPVALRWSACYAALCVLLLVGHWQTRQFIYMQF